VIFHSCDIKVPLRNEAKNIFHSIIFDQTSVATQKDGSCFRIHSDNLCLFIGWESFLQ
ncbi:hypothetical protein STEG23_003180, partial [Scotinomys teguina]